MDRLVLIWVGAVLCLNGVSLLTPIDPREVAVINLFVAAVTGFVALWSATRQPLALPAVLGGAAGLMFPLTYLWNGVNTLTGADGRGLDRRQRRRAVPRQAARGMAAGRRGTCAHGDRTAGSEGASGRGRVTICRSAPEHHAHCCAAARQVLCSRCRPEGGRP